MAEYKNGVNFMGIMSVDKDDVTLDIQTGRAVFADNEKYQNDPKYKARVDQYVREGFHLINEGSGGSGGAEPLIIGLDHEEDYITYYDKTWQEVYDALLAGRTVIVVYTIEGATYTQIVTAAVRNPLWQGGGPYWVTSVASDHGGSIFSQNLWASSADGYLYIDMG